MGAHTLWSFLLSKAMAISRGTVTVLDAGGMTYSRIWCCFEIFKSLLDAGDGDGVARKTYDVYTACDLTKQDRQRKEGAVGIVEGVAAGDKDAAARSRAQTYTGWLPRHWLLVASRCCC